MLCYLSKTQVQITMPYRLKKTGKKVGAQETTFAGTANLKHLTFKCLRKPKVHVKMKSTEHSYHSKYIILEAKHKRYIYKHKFSPKTNPRDH